MIRENDEESIATEKKEDDIEDEDSEEELGRSDVEINLDHVSVKSTKSTSAK